MRVSLHGTYVLASILLCCCGTGCVGAPPIQPVALGGGAAPLASDAVIVGQDSADEPSWLGEPKKSKLGLPKLSIKPPTLENLLAGPQTPMVGGMSMKYEEADKIFQQATAADGDARLQGFRQASGIYREVAENSTADSLKEDALYMVGESLFFAERYPDALEAFDELIKQYPRTRHMDRVDKRRFAIAQYWQQKVSSFSFKPNFTNSQQPAFDTFGHALRVYNRIRFDDPTGKLADDATMAAAVANFEAGRYALADTLFEDLRDNFPSSEHQFQGHLLLLKCKLKRYLGPNYDGTVLDEAEELIRQMLVQFPGEAEPHREYLEKEAKQIRLMKAQRLYVKAEYRDRRKEFRAARMLYEQVRNEFGDTNLAVKAESRLAELQGRPDRPTERLQWLADLFPEEKQPKPLIATGGTGGKRR